MVPSVPYGAGPPRLQSAKWRRFADFPLAAG